MCLVVRAGLILLDTRSEPRLECCRWGKGGLIVHQAVHQLAVPVVPLLAFAMSAALVAPAASAHQAANQLAVPLVPPLALAVRPVLVAAGGRMRTRRRTRWRCRSSRC